MKRNFPPLRMTEFSRQYAGKNLVSMHNTNPQVFTQKELEQTIGKSMAEILQDVNLGFSADEGTEVLRHVIAENLYKTMQAAEIITHAGAAEALFCAFHAILQANDKVLIVAPVFEPLVQVPKNLGCEIEFIHLNSEDNWSLDFNELEAIFKQGCQLFVINFPHNPTGVTLTHSQLNRVIKLCQKYDVWLLSDEVFRGLEHDKKDQLPAVADIYAKGISIAVISKAFALGGVRIGWLACKNKQILARIIEIKAYLSICNSQFDEKIASVILQKPKLILNRHLKIINNNKQLLNNFKVICGYKISFFTPKTGCCLFAKIEAKITASQLVDLVADKCNYLLYPDELFFSQSNAVRIGFGNNQFPKFIKEVTL